MRRLVVFGAVCVGVLIGLSVSLYALPGGADAWVGRIPYQGSLLVGDQPADGLVQMAFSLYSTAQTPTSIWSEGLNVQVHDGKFAVVLGENESNPIPASAFTGHAIYLGVHVEGQALAERQRILAVPFATQGVPSGAIMMFESSCPYGWEEYLAMRGRFPRGEPSGNPQNRDYGGTDDAVVVEHSHTGETQAAGAHTHTLNNIFRGAGTDGNPGLAAGASFQGNADISTAPDHTHAFTTGTTGMPGTGLNMPAFLEMIFCRKL